MICNCNNNITDFLRKNLLYLIINSSKISNFDIEFNDTPIMTDLMSQKNNIDKTSSFINRIYQFCGHKPYGIIASVKKINDAYYINLDNTNTWRSFYLNLQTKNYALIKYNPQPMINSQLTVNTYFKITSNIELTDQSLENERIKITMYTQDFNITALPTSIDTTKILYLYLSDYKSYNMFFNMDNPYILNINDIPSNIFDKINKINTITGIILNLHYYDGNNVFFSLSIRFNKYVFILSLNDFNNFIATNQPSDTNQIGGYYYNKYLKYKKKYLDLDNSKKIKNFLCNRCNNFNCNCNKTK